MLLLCAKRIKKTRIFTFQPTTKNSLYIINKKKLIFLNPHISLVLHFNIYFMAYLPKIILIFSPFAKMKVISCARDKDQQKKINIMRFFFLFMFIVSKHVHFTIYAQSYSLL